MAYAVVCDVCGEPARDGSVTLTFGTEAWSLDLCSMHRASVAEQVRAIGWKGQFIRSDRILKALTHGLAPAKRPYRAAEGVSMTEVRKWAKEQGLPVQEVGRISRGIIQQYKAAHPEAPEPWPGPIA